MDPITIALALASQFAPGIIKHFTNSDTAATVAGQVLDIAKTVTGKSDPVEAQAALQVDPVLALQFQRDVMLNETALQTAYLSDTQSARNRDTEMTKAGNPNYRANVMAALAGLTVLVCLMVTVWNSDMDDFAKATLTLITGRALGWVEQVFNFEYGTNRASQKKDDTINKLSGV
jgi:hypothetical protein